MGERYHPLWHLTLSRLREFYREPGAVFWVFGFPVILAIGLGIAFRDRPPSVPVAGMVQTAEARAVFALLEASESVRVQWVKAEAQTGALRRGDVDVMVTAGPDGSVQYTYDPAREPSQVARLVVDGALQRASGRANMRAVEDVHVTQKGARYIDFLVPGLLGLNVMSSSLWGIGYSIVLNRKRRLLKRFAASPMRRSHYLLSYFLSRLVFLTAEVVALLGAGALLFDVGVAGSYFSVALICLLGTASFSGLALLVAARAESLEAANGWLNAVQLPMWLLSGSFFSYVRFPEFLHPFIQALPLTAANDALRAIMNDGVSLVSTWPQMGCMAAWGGIAFVIAVRTFRWQ